MAKGNSIHIYSGIDANLIYSFKRIASRKEMTKARMELEIAQENTRYKLIRMNRPFNGEDLNELSQHETNLANIKLIGKQQQDLLKTDANEARKAMVLLFISLSTDRFLYSCLDATLFGQI